MISIRFKNLNNPSKILRHYSIHTISPVHNRSHSHWIFSTAQRKHSTRPIPKQRPLALNKDLPHPPERFYRLYIILAILSWVLFSFYFISKARQSTSLFKALMTYFQTNKLTRPLFGEEFQPLLPVIGKINMVKGVCDTRFWVKTQHNGIVNVRFVASKNTSGPDWSVSKLIVSKGKDIYYDLSDQPFVFQNRT